MPDVFNKGKRSEVMAKIKSKGSKIELLMKQALEKNTIAYEYQPKVFGNPDFIVHNTIAIFCDSSFWHGRNWKKLKTQLKEGYWRDHIYKNRKRDILVTMTLKRQGFVVLRFWDDQIKKHSDECITIIQNELSKIKS